MRVLINKFALIHAYSTCTLLKYIDVSLLFLGIRLHVLHPPVHTERPDMGLHGQYICGCTWQRGIICITLCVNVLCIFHMDITLSTYGQ